MEKNGIILKESGASQRERMEMCSRYIKRVDLLRWYRASGYVYVVNLKPSGQDSYKLKVWAVHLFTFENIDQNYDVL